MPQNASRLSSENADGFNKKPSVIWTESDNKTGSRKPNGNVPNVNWDGDNMNVNWMNADNQNDNLRARAEVSAKERLKTKPLFIFLL